MNKNKTFKPVIVAVETSGRQGSVALARGIGLLEQISFSGPMKHSVELLPAVSSLLEKYNYQPSDVGQVYISIGPGSFTGLRIAASFAKSMNLAIGCDIVSVDTMDVIASNVADMLRSNGESTEKYQRVAAVLDAKRGQFFVAAYEETEGESDIAFQTGSVKYRKVINDCLMNAEQFVEQFSDKNKPIWLLGEGLVYYKDKFAAAGINFIDEKYWCPAATQVYSLGLKKAAKGEFADPLVLVPHYLRQPQLGVSKLLK